VNRAWRFLEKARNRQILGWIGGALVTVAVGAWAMVTYFWPVHEPAKPQIQQGVVSVGGNVTGSTITNTTTAPTNTGSGTEAKPAK
jgi:hypothetical protein